MKFTFAFGILALALTLVDGAPQLLEQSQPDERVVGGIDASPGDALYQIAMFRNGSFWCSGELLAPRTVLTAAHCVYGFEDNPSMFLIRYGSIDQTKQAEIPVSKVTHPLFSPETIYLDTTILTHSRAKAQIISIASHSPADESGDLLLTSWGYMKYAPIGECFAPNILQKATSLRVVNQKICALTWKSNPTLPRNVTESMICALGLTQSACLGDSGGPLVQNGVLVGTVSCGSPTCDLLIYPNVYANVGGSLRS